MVINPTLRDNFLRFVEPEPNSGCHLWAGGVTRSGNKYHDEYGSFNIRDKKKKTHRTIRSHRFAWEMAHGTIPDGLSVLHKCDVRLCVNPDHLFLGTTLDNGRDMAKKGRGTKGTMPFGVTKMHRKFRAQIRAGNRDIYLGLYSTAAEAHTVALKAKMSYG
jgi:hypothetical protein